MQNLKQFAIRHKYKLAFAAFVATSTATVSVSYKLPSAASWFKRKSSPEPILFNFKNGLLASTKAPKNFNVRYHYNSIPYGPTNFVLTILDEKYKHQNYFPGCHTNSIASIDSADTFAYATLYQKDLPPSVGNLLTRHNEDNLRVEYIGPYGHTIKINDKIVITTNKFPK